MKVTWILPDGARISADVAEGETLMQAAVDNDARLIPGEMENLMRDVTGAARQPASRLGCQIEARAGQRPLPHPPVPPTFTQSIRGNQS
jgi:ferredoxin, 2Fe-2S